MTLQPYPPASRDDIVEEMHGTPSPTPTDGWRIPTTRTPRTGWRRRTNCSAEVGGLPGRDGFESGSPSCSAPGIVGAPVWRGERRFFMRRTAEQEHAVLYTVDPDGTERALIDPMALDPTGTTTLDAWQPDKEGRLLAYQLSDGGDEESQPVRHGHRDRRAGRGADRPVPLLPRRLAARRRGLLLRPPAARRPGARRARSSTTAGSTCTGSAPTPSDDVLIFGDGLEKTNYYGVGVTRDGRWLHDLRLARAPRRATTCGSPTSPPPPPAPPELRRRPGGRGRPDRPARRPRRPGATSSPTATPRAAGSCVTDPSDPPSPRTGAT